MSYVPENPLVVQSDQTLLLETASPLFEETRDALLAFAELVKSPEYVHTWRITPLSLWNAAAAGHTADEVADVLARFARYPVPPVVNETIRMQMERYGRLRLVRDGRWLRLESDDPIDLEEVKSIAQVGDLFAESADRAALRVHPRRRGELKRMLTALGHPVRDLAGYDDGDELRMDLAGSWSLRDYQVAAIDSFLRGPGAGSGVVVLPCGAGKTVVGVGAMARLGMRTLVLCTGSTAVRQWKREILARTTLTEEQVGEYGATRKELRPVTLTTYQMLSWRKTKATAPAHFDLFHRANWGLVIYDEVHLLPAPMFRETAALQSRRRLGLTGTLVREDGRETDVFALVGPKLFDVPWKALEHQGWIATARCVEIKIPFSDADRLRYLATPARAKSRLASTNARKGPVVEALLEGHQGEQILVLGTDLDQLRFLARKLGLPIVTGETSAPEREELFDAFRRREIPVLALSKVGNFSIDLPGASVAIQVSGTFGSRQEEAQRLGRILRPHPDGQPAAFYTLVTADSDEEDYAQRRQLFLTEQGYPYRIERAA